MLMSWNLTSKQDDEGLEPMVEPILKMLWSMLLMSAGQEGARRKDGTLIKVRNIEHWKGYIIYGEALAWLVRWSGWRDGESIERCCCMFQ